MSIERMDDFFAARVDGYDEHMRQNVEGLNEAYALLPSFLPKPLCRLLDLGCGTGLELASVFEVYPDVEVTGVDLSREMLDALRRKYPASNLCLIHGSYFEVGYGDELFDAAVSVESLHHFTHDEKTALYRRVYDALAPTGVYIEIDYVASSQEEENALFSERARLYAQQGIKDGLWHFDVPCTIENQVYMMRNAGFVDVTCEKRWASTALIVAKKG